MNYKNRIVVTIIKIATVLLIPYYWIMQSVPTGGINQDTSYLISGPIGYWSSAGTIYEFPTMPTIFWEQNQILFSILFILPMVFFAIYFGERKTNRKTIGIGMAAILIPFFIMYISTPFIPVAFAPVLFYYTLPNVLSLSMFVFVFWTVLRNSWPSTGATDESQENKGMIAQAREILGSLIPRDAVSIIWVCMAILPAILSLYLQLDPTDTIHIVQISGGLYYFMYDYRLFSGGGYYPSRYITYDFETAAWASMNVLTLWIANLLLGYITLKYIQKETTKKRLYYGVGILLLIILIPSLLITIIGNMFGAYVSLTLPLPFFPIAMLLLARFANPLDASTKDMIKVPLKTRISSVFQRGSTNEETDEIGLPNDAKKDGDLDSSSD